MKKKQLSSHQLTRLSGQSWERWKCGQSLNERALLLDNSPEPPISLEEGGVFVVPSRRVVSLPVWVDVEDPQLIRQAVDLQLEVRGVASAEDDDIIRTTICSEQGRSLVLCQIFPSDLGTHFPAANDRPCVAGPLILGLEPDAVSIWREGQDYVAGLTRGENTIFWATFEANAAASLPIRIDALIAQLVATDILVAHPDKIILDEALVDDPVCPGFPEAQHESIAPMSTGWEPFTWLPPAAREQRRKSAQHGRTRQILAVAAALYLVLVGAGASHSGFLWWREYAGRQELAGLEAQLGELRPIMKDWRVIGPSVETSRYPLEVFRELVAQMPREGVRLTSYNFEGEKIVVEGEAVSAPLATKYFGAVQESPDIAQIAWTMPSPTLLPTNVAKFQIIGAMP